MAFSIAGPIAGYYTVRVGERTNAVLGAVVLVASMLVLATVGVGSTDLVIMAGLALSGIGMGTASPAIAAAIANSVDERDLGVVSAAQQMVSQVGVVAGIQILLTVQAAREPVVGAAASYHVAYLVGAAAAAIGVGARRLRAQHATRTGRPRGRPVGTARTGLIVGLIDQIVISLIFSASATAAGVGWRLLHGHHLGHVALDLDLAGHERLHPGLRVLLHEDGLGGVVVDGHGEVGVLELAEVEVDLAVGGVHEDPDVGAVVERGAGDDLVHADRVGGRGLRWTGLVAETLGLVHPLLAEEFVGHGLLLGTERGRGCRSRTLAAPWSAVLTTRSRGGGAGARVIPVSDAAVPGAPGPSNRAARLANHERNPKWQHAPLMIDMSICINCDTCIRHCPPQFGAIFNHGIDVIIIPELCSGCEKCLEPCPVDCIFPDPDWKPAPQDWWDEPAMDDPYR